MPPPPLWLTLMDYLNKIQRAIQIDGPTYIHLLSPCINGWGLGDDMGVSVSRLGVETCINPVYEMVDGYKLKSNVRPKEKKPVEEYLKVQGRFKHLFAGEKGNRSSRRFRHRWTKTGPCSGAWKRWGKRSMEGKAHRICPEHTTSSERRALSNNEPSTSSCG